MVAVDEGKELAKEPRESLEGRSLPDSPEVPFSVSVSGGFDSTLKAEDLRAENSDELTKKSEPWKASSGTEAVNLI